MAVSPFTFYRGAALNMAVDLAETPSTGLQAQLCGDCHLLNFGAFATPERRVIFDINDFDETLPGLWEWDLKRLAVSFVHAARSNGFDAATQRDAVMACVRSYRKRIERYGRMPALDVWYARIDIDAVVDAMSGRETRARIRGRVTKEAGRSLVETDFPKLAEHRGSKVAIKDNPPLIYHHQKINLSDDRNYILQTFVSYPTTLPDERRLLLERYRLVDFALKVVGVGSVGTFCGLLLMMGPEEDPLFIQVKEARRSVLEAYQGKSTYPNHGERVVVGQRLMQSASDIFLGWASGGAGRHFYFRQLRDMKLKPLVEVFDPSTMLDYARLCGWTLARAHARFGRCGDDLGVRREERRPGPCHHEVLARLRRPGRARPPRLPPGGPERQGRGGHGALLNRSIATESWMNRNALVALGKLPLNINASAYYNVVHPDLGPLWQLRVQVAVLLPASLISTLPGSIHPHGSGTTRVLHFGQELGRLDDVSPPYHPVGVRRSGRGSAARRGPDRFPSSGGDLRDLARRRARPPDAWAPCGSRGSSCRCSPMQWRARCSWLASSWTFPGFAGDPSSLGLECGAFRSYSEPERLGFCTSFPMWTPRS